MKRFRTSILSAVVAFVFFTLSGKEDHNGFKNTGSICYGSNTLVGKYYTIRGFSMYAETYGVGQP